MENVMEGKEALQEGTAAEEEPKTLIERTESLLLIAPAGRLDTVMSNDLKEMLKGYDTDGVDIELDFAKVEYISSAGLRLLVSLQKQTKAGGHGMVIKNTNAVVNEGVRVSGVITACIVL